MGPEDQCTKTFEMASRCNSCSKPQADHEKAADLTRRGFLGNTLASTAAVLAGFTLARTPPALAQSIFTPDEALKALMDGNERYVAGNLQSLNEDLAILKASRTSGADLRPEHWPSLRGPRGGECHHA